LGVEVFATSRCARWDEAGTLRVPVACDRDQRVRRRTDQSATKPSLIGSEIFLVGVSRSQVSRAFRVTSAFGVSAMRLAMVGQENEWATKKKS
jgi:hypothetical protein